MPNVFISPVIREVVRPDGLVSLACVQKAARRRKRRLSKPRYGSARSRSAQEKSAQAAELQTASSLRASSDNIDSHLAGLLITNDAVSLERE